MSTLFLLLYFSCTPQVSQLWVNNIVLNLVVFYVGNTHYIALCCVLHRIVVYCVERNESSHIWGLGILALLMTSTSNNIHNINTLSSVLQLSPCHSTIMFTRHY